MIYNTIKSTYLFLFMLSIFCDVSCKQPNKINDGKNIVQQKIVPGANRTGIYIPLLKGKRIAIVANQTSIIEKKSKFNPEITSFHLVDYIHNSKEIEVVKVFAPEHGFRGKADAGEHIKDGIDSKTGLPIISLYGKNKKPSKEQLTNIDVVVFDIQDVGVRFYTYISTLHYIMEACAENNIPLILLDRPNPNGHYIDGPLLESEHKSFVGMHPIPVVYGMTIGEYGKMINGEGWLENQVKCDLTVISIKNYTHTSKYSLPVKPSPNLPNDTSINLYPSLCFFEGTNVSAGRGTNFQFQIYGSPFLNEMNYTFTPKPNDGAKYPKHKEKTCFGEDLRNTEHLSKLNLKWLIKAYQKTDKKEEFFNKFFTKLAGTELLQSQIEKGLSQQEIENSWKKDLENFKKIRKKYLIYD
ncbi:exo-beta-N-acetylmuramidase NamZ domain-containing protein [Tenacibaculum sp. MEBiC06402]|uniref:exo-beta-N-acetylmuramidase NamZ family protein n=1 Tax=unclassified Tenacibaculum TaxID=2635139 RepID=UPI003B9CB6AC